MLAHEDKGKVIFGKRRRLVIVWRRAIRRFLAVGGLPLGRVRLGDELRILPVFPVLFTLRVEIDGVTLGVLMLRETPIPILGELPDFL
jgi:hypothetical protein